jgi:hypothetical protein
VKPGPKLSHEPHEKLMACLHWYYGKFKDDPDYVRAPHYFDAVYQVVSEAITGRYGATLRRPTNLLHATRVERGRRACGAEVCGGSPASATMAVK